MGPLATAYTLATLAMFLVCAIARNCTDDADRVARAAAWLAFGVGMSRIVSALVPAPWSMAHYPAQDLFMLALCLGWFQVRREWWAVLLATCFAVQLYMHAAFWWAHDASALRSYIIQNNAVFIAELLILTVAGGRYVVAGIGARLRMLGGWHRPRLAYVGAS
jgi:hypothetical protein